MMVKSFRFIVTKLLNFFIFRKDKIEFVSLSALQQGAMLGGFVET